MRDCYSYVQEFPHALLTRRVPRMAGAEATEEEEGAEEGAALANALFSVLRTRGGVTTETVGVKVSERPMIRRKRALIEVDGTCEQRSWSEVVQEMFHGVVNCEEGGGSVGSSITRHAFLCSSALPRYSPVSPSSLPLC